MLTRQVPYQGDLPGHIIHQIMSGTWLPLPPYTPARFRALVTSCWARAPQERPTFELIVAQLGAMLGCGQQLPEEVDAAFVPAWTPPAGLGERQE